MGEKYLDMTAMGAAAPGTSQLGQAEDALAVGLLVVNALELAESTRRNYRRSWRACCEWFAAMGLDPLARLSAFSSGVGEGIHHSVVQSGREFPYIGVASRQFETL